MDKQFSPATYALLRGSIDDWLSEHVDPETGYVLDDSLTLENAAAQAKAVGDAQAAVTAALADKADKTEADELQRQILASFPTDSVSNAAVASFSDGADGIPVKTLTVNISPVQSGSGDPSPDNVRPISGWTGANIHNTRYGIFPIEVEKVVEGYYVLTIKNTRIRKNYTGTTTYNFLITGAQVSEVFNGYQNIPAGRYSFKGTVSSSKGSVTVTARFATSAGENPKDVVLNGGAVDIPAGYKLFNITMSVNSWSTDDWVQLDNFVLAIEPVDYAISWQTEAGTVYGGTLTDNGDGTWTLTARPYYASYNGETLVGPWVSSMDVYAEGATPTTGAQVVDLGGAVQTYTITAESVKTLLGDNNIFADCGDIAALTYRADPTLYIDKKLAAILPADPSTDGAYVLTDTVADGAATLSWEAGE